MKKMLLILMGFTLAAPLFAGNIPMEKVDNLYEGAGYEAEFKPCNSLIPSEKIQS